MNDVYDNEGHDVDDACVCIMERFERYYAYDYYQDIMSGEAAPFCPSCTETLRELTSNIEIYGN